jgi:hypothetical protein
MLKIDCDVCHAEVTVNMHISNPPSTFREMALMTESVILLKPKVAPSALNAVQKSSSSSSRRFIHRT